MYKLRYPLYLLLLLVTGLQAAPYQWQNITVGAGGFAPNIIYSLAEKDLAYLRTDMGGAYRWDNKLLQWIPLQDGMSQSNYFGIESLAADPLDPDLLYMAAGMYKQGEAAMLRSFDRGASWQITPVPFPMGGNEDGRGMGERLAIDPNNTQILYFGSRHDGLIKSTNKGQSWQKDRSFPYQGLPIPGNGEENNAGISFIAFDPTSKTQQGSQTLYVAIADLVAKHVYYSNDNGLSWLPVPNQPPPHLRPVKGQLVGDWLYITYSNNLGPNGITDGAVYKLNIRSHQWTDITPGHNDTPNKKGSQPKGGFMGLSVSQQNPDVLLVATMNRWLPGDTIFKSSNGGVSWQELRNRSSRDVSATPYLYWGEQQADFGWWIAGLAINPFNAEEVSYTTGATVYKTPQINSPGEISWQPWIKGIEQTAIITLRSLPEGPELLSGFGDISGFTHTDLDSSPQVMFTNPVFANTNSIDYAQLNPRIVVRSGTKAHRAEAGAATLAYSQDFAMSWQALTVPAIKLEAGKPAQRYDLSGDRTIISNADGAVFMFMAPIPLISTDRGKSWVQSKGLPLDVRPIADRVDPRLFYALDFNNSTFYVSRNFGKTFERIEMSGLPRGIQSDQPGWREKAWPLLAEPYRQGHLWFVSHKGVFFSDNGGQHFQKIHMPIQVLAMDFGKAAPGKIVPSLLAIAKQGQVKGIWRSDDAGRNWLKLNDERHQYGTRFRCIAGDLRYFGRVYVGTDGRGIVMGQPEG